MPYFTAFLNCFTQKTKITEHLFLWWTQRRYLDDQTQRLPNKFSHPYASASLLGCDTQPLCSNLSVKRMQRLLWQFSSNQKPNPQCSPLVICPASHPDDQSAIFLNFRLFNFNSLRRDEADHTKMISEREIECVSLTAWMMRGIKHLCSLCLLFFFFLSSRFPPQTFTPGLQIGQLYYQSAGPQIFKTNWIPHPIPITITAGTITKLAIQHNNWKCSLPGPAGLPGGLADLWWHVKPVNSTANYWCTAEWSCLSPKYHFQFTVRNTGPCWDRQKQSRVWLCF